MDGLSGLRLGFEGLSFRVGQFGGLASWCQALTVCGFTA